MKLKDLLNHDIFVFDLDGTVWHTFDKYNNSIWAKQMLTPFKVIDKNCIEDDVYSKCYLQSGVREVLEFLKKNNKELNFLSCGGCLHETFITQPAFKLLRTFKIKDYFSMYNCTGILYKSDSKANWLEMHSQSDSNKNKKIVFFDDDNHYIRTVQNQVPQITVIDRKSFNEWTDLL